jgi:hypothetical protein
VLVGAWSFSFLLSVVFWARSVEAAVSRIGRRPTA